jgi:hypothetical protein
MTRTTSVEGQGSANERFAREAKDPALINKAVETRLQSERKAGEMLREMAEAGERMPAGDPRSNASR